MVCPGGVSMAQVTDSQFYAKRVGASVGPSVDFHTGAEAPQPGGGGAGAPAGTGSLPGAGECAGGSAGMASRDRGAQPRSQGKAADGPGFRAPGYDARMGSCLQRARESLNIPLPTRAQLIAIGVLMCACIVLGLVALGTVGGHEVVIERGAVGSDSVDGALETPSEAAASQGGSSEVPAGESASAGPDSGAGESASDTHICIYITGEVQAPAVYDLPEGSRVADAIEAAGGATSQANLAAINLAKQLSDSEMIYVPSLADENVTVVGTSENVAESGGLVNVNTAGIDELKTLNGIGDSLAQAIVDEREKNGPFASVEDLVRVSGIGAKTLARFSDKVCV